MKQLESPLREEVASLILDNHSKAAIDLVSESLIITREEAIEIVIDLEKEVRSFMKGARERTYVTPHGVVPRVVDKVVITETYENSHHWWVKIYFSGYGDAAPYAMIGTPHLQMGGVLDVQEGYGIFRIEQAIFFATSLTGTHVFSETTLGAVS